MKLKTNFFRPFHTIYHRKLRKVPNFQILISKVAFNVIKIVKQGLKFIGFQESNSREPHILRVTKLLPSYV